MKEVKATTNKGQWIVNDFRRRHGYDDIFSAYVRPSAAKIRAYREIERRAENTPGYNYDLRVTGASCHTFSTIYSYTGEDGALNIVKDTRDNVYHVVIEK